jgi:hypothetical protein
MSEILASSFLNYNKISIDDLKSGGAVVCG